MNGVTVVITAQDGTKTTYPLISWNFNPQVGDAIGPNFAGAGIKGTVKTRTWPNLQTLEITLK